MSRQSLQETETLDMWGSAIEEAYLEPGTLPHSLKQFFECTPEPPAQTRTPSSPKGHSPFVVVRVERSSKAVQELLAKDGFVHSRRFSVLPSYRAPRWLLPLGGSNQMLLATRIYAPYAPTSRVLKSMFLRVIKAGWRGWGCGRLLVAAKAPLPLEIMVREITGESEPIFALSLGYGGTFRKLTIQVMRSDGEILGYIKFPITHTATSRVRHEAAVLQRLWTFAPLRPHIPRVLYANNWGDGFLLFQSAG